MGHLAGAIPGERRIVVVFPETAAIANNGPLPFDCDILQPDASKKIEAKAILLLIRTLLVCLNAAGRY